MDDGFEQLNADVFERYKAEGYSVDVRKNREGVWQCVVAKDKKPLVSVSINGWRKDLTTKITGDISEDQFRRISDEYFGNFSGEGAPTGEPSLDSNSGLLSVRSKDSGRTISFRPGLGENEPSIIEIFVARQKFASLPDEDAARGEINRLVPLVGRVHHQLPPILTSNVYELARRELSANQPNLNSK